MAEQEAPAPPPPNAGKVSLTNWDPTGFEEAARLAKSCRAGEFVSLKASEEKKQKEASKAVDAHATQNKAIKSQMRSQVRLRLPPSAHRATPTSPRIVQNAGEMKP